MPVALPLCQSLMKSWEICNLKGLPRNMEKPILRLTKEELKKEIEKKRFNT